MSVSNSETDGMYVREICEKKIVKDLCFFLQNKKKQQNDAQTFPLDSKKDDTHAFTISFIAMKIIINWLINK